MHHGQPNPPDLIWQRIGDHPLPMPAPATDGAAGYDLAWSGADHHPGDLHTTILQPGEARYLNTGWAVAIPPGYVGLIRDRSGMAKRALTTRAGVIDSDYRGEIRVMLRNEGQTWAEIPPGTRIAQMLIIPCHTAPGREVATLDDTARGTNGFGSTGT